MTLYNISFSQIGILSVASVWKRLWNEMQMSIGVSFRLIILHKMETEACHSVLQMPHCIHVHPS